MSVCTIIIVYTYRCELDFDIGRSENNIKSKKKKNITESNVHGMLKRSGTLIAVPHSHACKHTPSRSKIKMKKK